MNVIEQMNSIEPLRRFQIDKQYKAKLELIKNQFEQSSKLFDMGFDKIKPFAMPINAPFHLARNFKDFQQILYKYNETLTSELQFIQFWHESRQIFKFDNNLALGLANTSIDDIPWSEIKLPYDDFYISFFNENCITFKIELTGCTYMIDGAYVKHIKAGDSLIFKDDSIIIDFSSRLIEPDYSIAIKDCSPGILFTEPSYSFILSGKINETLKQAFDRGEEEYLRHCDYMDNTNYEQSMVLMKGGDKNFADTIKLPLMREKYFRGKEFIKHSLPILFNCIFYLTQYPENINNRFNNHEAKIAYKKLERTYKLTSEAELNRKLIQQDYTKLKFVRDPIFNQVLKISRNDKTIKTHWRRGHWRNHFVGGKDSHHKHIWIQPTIVNKKLGGNFSGHIYDVDKE